MMRTYLEILLLQWHQLAQDHQEIHLDRGTLAHQDGQAHQGNLKKTRKNKPQYILGTKHVKKDR